MCLAAAFIIVVEKKEYSMGCPVYCGVFSSILAYTHDMPAAPCLSSDNPESLQAWLTVPGGVDLGNTIRMYWVAWILVFSYAHT